MQSEDDSGNESDDGTQGPSGKRRRFNPEALEKRRERRLWEEKKQVVVRFAQLIKAYSRYYSIVDFSDGEEFIIIAMRKSGFSL